MFLVSTMNAKEFKALKDSVEQRKTQACGDLTWTVEPGHGETYHTGKPTLYAHDEYPRSSVLHGQPRRTYIHEFDSKDEAQKVCVVLKLKPDFYDSGTTHVSSEVLTRHLPGEPL